MVEQEADDLKTNGVESVNCASEPPATEETMGKFCQFCLFHVSVDAQFGERCNYPLTKYPNK